jgi:hypothetical protein
VATCATDRRRPGSELGLRRFISYREAVTAAAGIKQKHSQIYFLDERHFGFGIGTAGTEPDLGEVDRALQAANELGASKSITTYHWTARFHELAQVASPAALWTLEDHPEAAANPTLSPT